MVKKTSQAPWLNIAQQELDKGIKEFPGDADNPRIVEYHSCTSYGSSDDETPWCSSFANWCMKQCGIEGTHNVAAQSWLHWGKAIATPIEGAVTILWRESPSSWKGHVGFFIGEHPTNKDYILLLGGNQGDSVCVAAYEKKRVLGFRFPA
ncbi:TIGR02594 family protein [Aeromonas sp. BC14]|uniref:TIGR02594 family protein n=1 Tax=Aeromonas TaxID=642 RepID=UPI00227B545C|nr:TIGR02594 family protein [Aeromonas sp. BC14]WAF93126.1 TIGR02594 family protein [Aeromonas sp. BC14]